MMVLKRYFDSGHERSIKIKRHVILSFIFQGLDTSLKFILVPIILSCLGQQKYGVWLIFSSITAWFNFLDIGLNQGLRNNFAIALSNNDKELAKYYVSTTYAIIIVIMAAFFLSFLIVNHFLDWTKILNVKNISRNELCLLPIIVFGSYSTTFVLSIITTMLLADQRTSALYLKNLINSIITFILIVILFKTARANLLIVGSIYCFSPIITLLIFTLYFFSFDYREFVPSLRYISYKHAGDLINLGLKFFIINIAVVVLFTTDDIIITQLFGPAQVTPYEITKKLFTFPLMVFSIIVRPLWSAVTDAYNKKDYEWIKKTIIRLQQTWFCFFGVIILILFGSKFIYRIWIGNEVQIPFLLSLIWALFVCMQSYNSIFTYFLNGTGILQLQLFTACFSIIFNIPLSIMFAASFKMGISGVILGTSVSMFVSIILKTVQYNKIINEKARWIWAA